MGSLFVQVLMPLTELRIIPIDLWCEFTRHSIYPSQGGAGATAVLFWTTCTGTIVGIKPGTYPHEVFSMYVTTFENKFFLGNTNRHTVWVDVRDATCFYG